MRRHLLRSAAVLSFAVFGLGAGIAETAALPAGAALAASPSPSPSVAPSASPNLAPSPIPTASPTPTPSAQPTGIELSLPPPTPTSAELTVAARLTSQGGGVAGSHLRCLLDGAEVVQVTTDSGGGATVKLPRDLPAGSHTVGFTFAGDPARLLEPSSVQGSLVLISPVGTSIGLELSSGRRTGQQITVGATIYHDGQPLPAAGVHLSVAGHQVELASDGSGKVAYHLPRTLAAGSYAVNAEYRGDQAHGFLGSTAAGKLTVLPELASSISLSLPPPTKAGQRAEISGQLSSTERPLGPRKAVHLLVDNRKKATLETDSGGSVHFKIPRNLSTGPHSVTLVYHGDRPEGIAGSSASGSLTIAPLGLRLQTLPALAGVTFTLDGGTYVTDSSGSVDVGLTGVGTHQVSVRAPDDRPDAHVRFSHWFDEGRDPARSLRVFADGTVYAAFTGSFLTPLSIRDAGGRALDRSKLGPIQLRGPSGQLVDVGPDQAAVWLDVPPPSRAALLGLGPGLRYSVESAQFEGLKVANRGDDVFSPGPARRWEIRLRVYALRLQVRQPLLGSGAGTVAVTSATGARRLVHLDAGGGAFLTGLPRGLYTVAAVDTSAAPTTKVQMTRDQVVDLSSFTPMELAAGGTLCLLLLAALSAAAVAVRRPDLLSRLRR